MKQSYPKISIVTPSYNQGKFLDEAIKSVVNQDYPNFEHIIFDNCSTDGTLDILRRYPHLIWTSEPDKGQSDALNKGFKKASGEFIGWLNADDLYLPNCFHSIAKILKEHPEHDILYGDYRWVDQKGRLIKLCREIDFDLFIFKYLHVTYVPSTTVFFRSNIFKEGSLVDTGYAYSMDFELFLRLALKGHRFIHTRKFLADFRWHAENKSRNWAKQSKERNDALFLHDMVMQRIYKPILPGVRFLFMLAARAKRALSKALNLVKKF